MNSGFYLAVITSGHVVRHEVDHGLQLVLTQSGKQGLQLFQTRRGIGRIIWTDIEVILDRERTPGHAFQQIGIVRRFSDF